MGRNHSANKPMNRLSNIYCFLKGKKAYIVGFLMIALGLLQGDNSIVLEGLGIMSLRAGISKTAK